MARVVVLLLFTLCKTYHAVPNTRLMSTPTENFIPCEKGWYMFGGKCFKFGGYVKPEKFVDRLEAERICASLGGTLASIHSQEQNDFFSIMLAEVKGLTTPAWIGLQRYNSGIFVWDDGSPFDYQNWAPGEPNNSGLREDFGALRFDSDLRGNWNDVPYTNENGYICQKSENSSLMNSDPRFCPLSLGGGLKFRDSCYRFISEKKSWMDAEEYCKTSFNGHLVTVLDVKHDFVLNYMFPAFENPLWIGIMMQPGSELKWTSGWYVDYEKFTNETKKIEDGNCILRWNQTVWTSVPCEEKYPFICEKSSVMPPALKPPTVPSRCPKSVSNLKDLGGEYCYYIDTKRNISWFKSEIECVKMGGSLASILSLDEERILEHFVKNVYSVHIGLNRLLTDDNLFTWSDGSQVIYTHWGYNQPQRGDEKCVDLQTPDMSWHDYLCSEEKGFICKVKKVEILPKELEKAEAISSTFSYGVSPGAYFAVFELLIIFALLAYISRKWIKYNILNRFFYSSPESRKNQETLSNENLIHVNEL